MKKFLAALVVIAIIFSCKKKDHTPPPTTPLVTTAALTNVSISSGTATAGGSIVSDGGAAITKSGIVWSKTNNTPTITDSIVSSTTATGTFTNNITGLDFGNTYYFRAFATNSVGTGYGSVVTLTTSSDSVKFTYNGQSVTYGIITSPTTAKKWLDRNIGAKQQATAYSDYLAYGDLFQWGRPADGHQLINWTAINAGTAVYGVTTVLATSDMPGHNNFINGNSNSDPSTGNGSYDWRDNNNRNRWATTSQGPCPTGWHVPTNAEWLAEVSSTRGGTATSGGMTNGPTAYSLLKLTLPGWRDVDGTFVLVGSRTIYWSSDDEINSNPGFSQVPIINILTTGLQRFSAAKAAGCPVRCIKN